MLPACRRSQLPKPAPRSQLPPTVPARRRSQLPPQGCRRSQLPEGRPRCRRSQLPPRRRSRLPPCRPSCPPRAARQSRLQMVCRRSIGPPSRPPSGHEPPGRFSAGNDSGKPMGATSGCAPAGTGSTPRPGAAKERLGIRVGGGAAYPAWPPGTGCPIPPAGRDAEGWGEDGMGSPNGLGTVGLQWGWGRGIRGRRLED